MTLSKVIEGIWVVLNLIWIVSLLGVFIRYQLHLKSKRRSEYFREYFYDYFSVSHEQRAINEAMLISWGVLLIVFLGTLIAKYL